MKPEKGDKIGAKPGPGEKMAYLGKKLIILGTSTLSVVRDKAARLGKKLIILGISTLSGVVAGIVVLIVANASLLRMPDVSPQVQPSGSRPNISQPAGPAEPDYKAIIERNLFRAKLQIEIPRAKSEKEIEEETLTAVVKSMALKGVMLSGNRRDSYAVIDLGGQKGVWVYEVGEVIENGLALKEIRKDSVMIEKGEFTAVLKLFASAFERVPASGTAKIGRAQDAGAKAGTRPAKEGQGGDISKEGSLTVISKSLAQKLKTDNNVIMSSIAVKPGSDGLKVVTVDRGSIAERIGIAPDDTIQEVNGHTLGSSEDVSAIYEALKNATDFEVRVLRGGKPETLRYEIR